MPTRILAVERLATSTGEQAPAWLAIRDGLVHETGTGTPPGPVDERIEGVVVPGFVDAHAHGAVGHDFRSAGPDGARAIAAHHRAAGTTDLVASIGTAPLPVLERQLTILADLVRDGTLAGLHLEGPYLSPTERRGAHDPALLRVPDRGELRRLLEAAGGTLAMLTLAPELPGAAEAIRLLVGEGVRVAIGHTACSTETARAALADGATAFTHLFNGMPPIAGREPGPVAAALESPSAHVELIGDGRHLADGTLALVRHVAAGRVALVSDAMQATGQGDGDYGRVTVRGGEARAPGGSLAGSTSTLGTAAMRLYAASDMALPELVELTSAAAARFLGLSRDLVPGTPANLVVLTGTGRTLGVARAMRHGWWAER
ncbi:MAG: N-acetylglucosamine-6-phosphate deacetylase [Amnibacterium sp.]